MKISEIRSKQMLTLGLKNKTKQGEKSSVGGESSPSLGVTMALEPCLASAIRPGINQRKMA